MSRPRAFQRTSVRLETEIKSGNTCAQGTEGGSVWCGGESAPTQGDKVRRGASEHRRRCQRSRRLLCMWCSVATSARDPETLNSIDAPVQIRQDPGGMLELLLQHALPRLVPQLVLLS